MIAVYASRRGHDVTAAGLRAGAGSGGGEAGRSFPAFPLSFPAFPLSVPESPPVASRTASTTAATTAPVAATIRTPFRRLGAGEGSV